MNHVFSDTMESLKSSNKYYRIKQRYKSQPFDTNHKISSPARSLDYINRKGRKKYVQPEIYNKVQQTLCPNEPTEVLIHRNNGNVSQLNNLIYYGMHPCALLLKRMTQLCIICNRLGIQMVYTLSIGTYIPLILSLFDITQSYFNWIMQTIDSVDQKYSKCTPNQINKVQHIMYDRKLTPEEALAHACDLWATFHTNRGSGNANVLSFQSFINTKLAMHDNSVVLLTNSSNHNIGHTQNPIHMSKLKYIFKLVISAQCIMISLIMMILKGPLSYKPKTENHISDDTPTAKGNILNSVLHQIKALKMLLRDLLKAIYAKIFGKGNQPTIEPCIETLIQPLERKGIIEVSI